MEFDLRDRTILLTVAGSRAYGVHTPESDLDVKGVCVPTAPYIVGCFKRFEQADKPSHMEVFEDILSPELREVVSREKLEGSVYGIRKFLKMASEANPNILDVLFCRESEVLYQTAVGKLLRNNRRLFLSKRAFFTVRGYAKSQLSRIKTHRKWIEEPILEEPCGEDFSDKVAYKSAHQKWKQYQNWVQTRNPRRAALEAEFGYDCKHAMHLIRLYRMGAEILRDGEVNIWRDDADFLRSIRRGALTYDELMALVEEEDRKIQSLFMRGQCAVPSKPDVQKIDDMCCSIVQGFLRECG